MPSHLRSSLRQAAEARPELTRRVATVARAAGARGTGDRLDGLVRWATPVTIDLPDHLPARTRQIVLDPCGGRDQVVVALANAWEDFERPMPDAFVALVHHRGGPVLDVGANTGLYSILATAVDAGCRAVAFEPFPPVVELLRRNLALNEGGLRVEVVEAAVSDEAGEAELFIPDPAHGLVESSCSLNGSFKEATAGTVRVQVTTLDDFLVERPELRPTVIKVDVESLEHAVLTGARGALIEHRPLVFVEVLHVGDPVAIEALRMDLDYVDVRLAPDGLTVDDVVRHDPDAWNHLLVPEELLADTLRVLASVGLAPKR